MQGTRYGSAFFKRQNRTSGGSAAAIVPYVHCLLQPASVVDVGCGSGAWTKAFHDCGARVVGIDGEYARPSLLFDPQYFVVADLRAGLHHSAPADLAVSVEVAEHLPTNRAAGFVRDLCQLSQVVLFSAAVPGQGGTNHINERPLSYWASHFDSCDFELFDIIRPRFWDSSEVAWWHRQNLVLFAARASDKHIDLLKEELRTAPPILDFIHPEALWQKVQIGSIWNNVIDRLSNPQPRETE